MDRDPNLTGCKGARAQSDTIAKWGVLHGAVGNHVATGKLNWALDLDHRFCSRVNAAVECDTSDIGYCTVT